MPELQFDRSAELWPDHPALAGIATPALIVEQAMLQANIARMADFARHTGVALRPHAKTHKSSVIARLQLQAGAIGIACATTLEAEALRAGGISDILLTSPVADAGKVGEIAMLNRALTLAVVVDHPDQVELLGAAVEAGDPALGVLIDIDLGQKRTGVSDMADAVTLAKMVASRKGLAFRGLQGFGGHIQHLVDGAERRAAASIAGDFLRSIKGALNDAGIACDVISGSGTGSSADDAQGPYTELQVGSYLFMDADYRRLRITQSAGANDGLVDDRLPYGPSLFVLGTVISANHPGQVTVDAGVKALAVNGPPPDIILGVPAGSRYQFAGDEHGVIFLPPAADRPKLGSRVLIAATHCDPTVNLHASYVFVSEGEGIRRVPIEGRYA